MTITFNFASLYETAARSLSIIGKRITDDNGNVHYKDITLGSNEQPLFTDYFRQAVIDISTEAAAFVTASAPATVTLTFPGNHNPQLETFVQQSCDAYCVSYALYSWTFIVMPRIAPRYEADCKRQLAALIRLMHEKTPPETPTDGNAHGISPLEISTTVTQNN